MTDSTETLIAEARAYNAMGWQLVTRLADALAAERERAAKAEANLSMTRASLTSDYDDAMGQVETLTADLTALRARLAQHEALMRQLGLWPITEAELIARRDAAALAPEAADGQ